MYLTKLKVVSEIYFESFSICHLKKYENDCFRINFIYFLPKQIWQVPNFILLNILALFSSLVSNIQVSCAWIK